MAKKYETSFRTSIRSLSDRSRRALHPNTENTIRGNKNWFKNTPHKLVWDIAELIKTDRLTPHPGTKLSTFEMHMGGTPNIITANLATFINRNKLSWYNVKLAKISDEKNLNRAPLTLKQIHKADFRFEVEIKIKRRTPKEQHPEIINLGSEMKEERGARSKSLTIEIENQLEGLEF